MSRATGILAVAFKRVSELTEVSLARFNALVLTWMFVWKAIEMVAGKGDFFSRPSQWRKDLCKKQITLARFLRRHLPIRLREERHVVSMRLYGVADRAQVSGWARRTPRQSRAASSKVFEVRPRSLLYVPRPRYRSPAGSFSGPDFAQSCLRSGRSCTRRVRARCPFLLMFRK